MKLFGVILLAAFAGLGAAAAQTAAPHASVPGTVAAVNLQSNQITLNTDKGEIVFTATDRTQILHAVAGEADPKKWSKMALSEITAGDRVMAYYRGALEQKPLLATALVVYTKADLAAVTQKDLEDWKKRGTTGTVTAVDAAAQKITIRSGRRELTVQSSAKTQFHRYSPDSAKPADAKPSSLGDIKTGDQVNVLGNKSEDGTTIAAEIVYAGTFRQIAATINSIDPATGEMKVTDLATKKPLTIRVTADSTMKKLPEQMAQMLASRYRGGGGLAAGGAGRQGGGGFRGGGGRGGPDLGQMLDGLPALPLSELKPKDAIMVSTTLGTDPTKVTAVMLLAGVEPILTASRTATQDLMSNWNLGGGGGAGGEQ